MDRGIVKLMQDDWYLILIQVQLLTIELLKGVLFLTIQVDAALGVILVAALLAANHSQVLHVAKCGGACGF